MAAWSLPEQALTPDQLEETLRAVGDERYHINHPFHKLMTSGSLTAGRCRPGRSTAIATRRAFPARTRSSCPFGRSGVSHRLAGEDRRS